MYIYTQHFLWWFPQIFSRRFPNDLEHHSRIKCTCVRVFVCSPTTSERFLLTWNKREKWRKQIKVDRKNCSQGETLKLTNDQKNTRKSIYLNGGRINVERVLRKKSVKWAYLFWCCFYICDVTPRYLHNFKINSVTVECLQSININLFIYSNIKRSNPFIIVRQVPIFLF